MNAALDEKRPQLVLLAAICSVVLNSPLPAATDFSGYDDPAEMEESETFWLGPLIYTRGRPVYDDVSSVNGGAIGSSVLMVRKPALGEADWFFVDGNYMYLQIPGYGQELVTLKPGMSVTSRAFYSWDHAEPADRNLLNYGLAKLYQCKGIPRHTPFIAQGSIWPDGLTVGQAKYALSRVDLRWVIECSPPGPLTDRCLVTAQEPPGGTVLAKYATVKLTVHCEDCPADGVGVGPGNTPDFAVKIVDIGDDRVEVIEGTITMDHTDDASSPTCPSAGRDFFWRLPPVPEGTQVRVRAHESSVYETVIVAWRDDGPGGIQDVPCNEIPDCCDSGLRPDITFTAPMKTSGLIMAELLDADEGPIKLVVEWTPPAAGEPAASASK